ncbi:MAG TPA: hypothetical protein VKZ88_00675 [Fibrobacteria bacterium]|nr:hypothetical protein [Fibrobacteria bacterium]
MRFNSMSAFVVPLFALLALAPTAAQAEDVNLNNYPETTTVALSRYAVGPGIGVVSAVSGDMADISDQFLSLSLSQSIRFRENWDLGIDAEWWAPGANFGGAMTVSYLLGTAAFRPFVGVGAGLQSLDYEGEKFGKGLGLQGIVHAGLYLDVLDNLQMRVRVPYRFLANSHRDQAAGLDVALLFSPATRTTKVRKLTY